MELFKPIWRFFNRRGIYEMSKKPSISSYYAIDYTLEGESVLHILNLEGGKSFRTIKFPKGTKLQLFVSKLPTEDIEGVDGQPNI
jgi:hypothetical protein